MNLHILLEKMAITTLYRKTLNNVKSVDFINVGCPKTGITCVVRFLYQYVDID